MKIQTQIDDYSSDDGFTMEVPGGKVRITTQYKNGCSIVGDKDGLSTLAIAMLTVAHNIGKAHPGAHIHVDEHPLLEPGSSSFVIGQLNESE